MRFVLYIALAPFVAVLADPCLAHAAAPAKGGLKLAQGKNVEVTDVGEVQAFELLGPGGKRILFGGTTTKKTVAVPAETSTFRIEKASATVTKARAEGTRTARKTKTKTKTMVGVSESVETQPIVSSQQRTMDGLAMLRRMAAKQHVTQAQATTSVVTLDPALDVLRTLSDADLAFVAAIPAAAVVACGNGAPAHHLLAGKIPDAAKRDALRAWVRGGGDWQNAVRQIKQERGI